MLFRVTLSSVYIMTVTMLVKQSATSQLNKLIDFKTNKGLNANRNLGVFNLCPSKGHNFKYLIEVPLLQDILLL